MSTRVLSSDAARAAVRAMQAILSGGLAEQLRRLDREGQTLSDPNVWDGRLAQSFRATWPATQAGLQRALAEVEDLRRRVEAITHDIMVAGGNA
jgi:uncharacterized protein YukE